MNNSRKNLRFISTTILIIFSLVIIVMSCSKTQHFELSRFISPETCSGCHGEIYNQWKNSMHNQSHRDVVYKEVALYMLKGLTDPDEIKEAESCVKCHTPVGVLSGFPKKTSDELDKVPDLAKEGIQCDYCHSVTGAYEMYNNGLKLDPGHGDNEPGTKRGPFKDSQTDFHKSAFSEFHTSSKICGSCHNVKHVAFGTWLETTYEEWEKGPYNSDDPEKRVPCQGCHMYHRPGVPATGSTDRPKNPGTAADDGPKREHIFTHYFVGGNSFVPGLFKDAVKARMAEERLKNAAELSIDDSKIGNGKLIIGIKNIGAGHYLPTGLTDVRQMWLEITIKDKNGRLVYSSGVLDENGYIPENAIVYNTVFGDGKGKPVTNIAKAREILKDRRIPPRESLRESIKLPEGKGRDIIIRIRLLYRIAPQKIVDIVFGKGKIKLPVITMATVEKKGKI
jgi:hypothetical protein